ncbi:hypothetical protein AM587_10012137 [Phytophthora nicotianae]|uniref:At2g23090-like zinc-binding domain-containing protein n=1 Tax=Phytophthora nicotianae TaxID=4792 RepID=A0A0W8CP18_PHYNI|nr:hypothetical protein AM587_10012137 [Phytophthora nicotianae]
MGGGNGQKSAAKRERNNAKKMKEAKNKNHAESKAKMEADRTGLKCKICMTTFLITASKTQLNDHYQSKHESKGFTLEQCFPSHI